MAENLITLNLQSRDTELDDIPDKREITMVKILKENRTCFNLLVHSLNLIATAVNKLSEVSQKTDSVETELNRIKENVLPEITRSINTKCNLVKAQLLERIEELEKDKLLDEAHRRRLNLIVNGLPVQHVPRGQQEPTEQLVKEMMKNKLKLESDYVNNIMFRDCHRLPKSRNHDGPPPVIMAFVLQAQRNRVLANAKNLKGTNLSLKSDLPKQLNTLRGTMLNQKTTLNGLGHECRVVERGYFPQLQIKRVNGADFKWETILSFNKKLPLEVALNPVLPRLDIPVIDVDDGPVVPNRPAAVPGVQPLGDNA